MKNVFILMIIMLHLLAAMTPIHAKGHLDSRDMAFHRAQTTKSREEGLEAVLNYYDVDQDSRVVILKLCLNPDQQKSIEQAQQIIQDTTTISFIAAAAATVLVSQEISSKTPYSYLREIGLLKSARELTSPYNRFASMLHTIMTWDSSQVPTTEPYRTWLLNGLNAELSWTEASELREYLHASILSSSQEKHHAAPYTLYALAYMHQMGDSGLLRELWQTGTNHDRELCLLIGSLAVNTDIILQILHLTSGLAQEITEADPNDSSYDRDHLSSLTYRMAEIFSRNKTVPGIGDRLREWAKMEDRQLFRTHQLYSIMGEPGWSQNDKMLNRSLLRDYLIREERIYEAAKEAVADIESRLGEKQ